MTLETRLAAFLCRQLGRPVEVSELVRLAGGASRETWSFRADGERYVLRSDPPGAPLRSERATEGELLRRAAEAGVPVPAVRWVCPDPTVLDAPFVIMSYVEGETIPRRILREDAYAAARATMAARCGEILARIHSVSLDGLSAIQPPPGQPAAAELERCRAMLDAFGEPHPVFEAGLRWLARRLPPAGRVVLVHGDFRLGNLVVGPEGVRAVLDWELAHAGDPWEDLGWLCMRAWRFGGPGEVGGFGDRDDLYAAYERASGVPVDREAVAWWEAFGTLRWGVICVAQAFTHLSGHVESVELAAIGRRAAECEYDLLELIS